jgi:hypothetical protein
MMVDGWMVDDGGGCGQTTRPKHFYTSPLAFHNDFTSAVINCLLFHFDF